MKLYSYHSSDLDYHKQIPPTADHKVPRYWKAEMNENTYLTITELPLIDYLELKEQLPPDTIQQVPAPAAPSGLHGEPVLITAAIMMSVAAAHALSTWLSRRHSEEAGLTMTIDADRNITIHMGTPPESARSGEKRMLSVSDMTSMLEEIQHAADSFGSSS